MGDVERSKQMTTANPAYDPERRGDERLPAAGARAPPQQPIGAAAKVRIGLECRVLWFFGLGS